MRMREGGGEPENGSSGQGAVLPEEARWSIVLRLRGLDDDGVDGTAEQLEADLNRFVREWCAGHLTGPRPPDMPPVEWEAEVVRAGEGEERR